MVLLNRHYFKVCCCMPGLILLVQLFQFYLVMKISHVTIVITNLCLISCSIMTRSTWNISAQFMKCFFVCMLQLTSFADTSANFPFDLSVQEEQSEGPCSRLWFWHWLRWWTWSPSPTGKSIIIYLCVCACACIRNDWLFLVSKCLQ